MCEVLVIGRCRDHQPDFVRLMGSQNSCGLLLRYRLRREAPPVFWLALPPLLFYILQVSRCQYHTAEYCCTKLAESHFENPAGTDGSRKGGQRKVSSDSTKANHSDPLEFTLWCLSGRYRRAMGMGCGDRPIPVGREYHAFVLVFTSGGMRIREDGKHAHRTDTTLAERVGACSYPHSDSPFHQ